jgi:hypothetical protein
MRIVVDHNNLLRRHDTRRCQNALDRLAQHAGSVVGRNDDGYQLSPRVGSGSVRRWPNYGPIRIAEISVKPVVLHRRVCRATTFRALLLRGIVIDEDELVGITNQQ